MADPYEVHKAESLADFTELAASVTRLWWETDRRYNRTLWWRGQQRSDWDLIPSLYRAMDCLAARGRTAELDLSSEAVFLKEFRPKARLYTGLSVSDDMEWSFVMRHHGLPTRLLDWSESALIALYFALRGDCGQNDVAVWGLDPRILNREWHRKAVLSPGDALALDYATNRIRSVAKHKPQLVERPIALRPSSVSQRMAAQVSRFTMHGTSRLGLNAQVTMPNALVKIVIPARRTKAVSLHLRRTARVTEDALFPDLDGLARGICDAFGVKWS